ncbi:MAG: hypothetical protein U9O94_09415 [Nanoarchaeota archaeon]|nr:hypothetical protein [Nanoarchaeota archaeon]
MVFIKGKLIFLLLLLIFIFSSMNFGEEVLEEEPEQASAQTTTKAYIQIPNFKVLDENNYDIITLIKDAEIPASYEGSLIRLESDDLTDIIRVITNLKTEKVVIFSEDLGLADRLEEQGILNVEIIWD